jgi:DNA-binding IclR family transcriptional regulator
MFVFPNMRFHNPLDDVLGNGIRVRVLRVLHSSRSQGLTGRELSRRAKASASQTIDALAVLDRAGLVYRETAGSSLEITSSLRLSTVCSSPSRMS